MNAKKKNQNCIKLVGFDLDDCLFDSTGLSERARIKGIEAMIKLGLKIDVQKGIKMLQEIVKEYGSNSSMHYDFFIKRLNQLEKIYVDYNDQIMFTAAAVMAYHKEKIDNIELYDDVEKCLKELKKRHIKIAIITDGLPLKQYEKILRLKINQFIDLVVISDGIGIKKPNPKLFDYCLKKEGVIGPEMIYVGDRIDKDIIPAKLNNIFSILIHRGGKYDTYKTGLRIPEGTKPDYEIKNLMEIFQIIEEIEEIEEIERKKSYPNE